MYLRNIALSLVFVFVLLGVPIVSAVGIGYPDSVNVPMGGTFERPISLQLAEFPMEVEIIIEEGADIASLPGGTIYTLDKRINSIPFVYDASSLSEGTYQVIFAVRPTGGSGDGEGTVNFALVTKKSVDVVVGSEDQPAPGLGSAVWWVIGIVVVVVVVVVVVASRRKHGATEGAMIVNTGATSDVQAK